MDILVALVVGLIAKIILWRLQSFKKPKKKHHQPLGVLLIGEWYYWILANFASAKH